MKSRCHLTLGSGRLAGLLALTVVLTVLLSGCGGGVGTGGTGSYASSTIGGFGSVIVGGVEFDDANAGVLDDDGAAVARDGRELRLGMTVEVDGTPIVASGTGQTASANTIRISTTVLGPVTGSDPAAKTLTVLGQQLQVNAATVFDTVLHGGLAALRPGDIVAAYALPDATSGRYVATRIEPAPAATAYRLHGLVSALDSAAHTLRIGAATLNYAGASGIPAGLAVGQVVTLRLPVSGSMSVAAFGPGPARPADGASAVAEGLVTSFAGPGAFVVNGLPVDASQAQIGPGSAPLSAGAYVSIAGQVSNGTLVATSVTATSQSAIAARTYPVSGSVSSLNTAAMTFVARNLVVDYSAARFVGGTPAGLADGVSVRVIGGLSSDGTEIRATQVLFK